MSPCKCLLLEMGITPNLKGFDCLCTAVAFVMTDKEKYRSGITKNLYPDIAKALGMTSITVERNIRHAISKAIALDHGEMKTLIGLSPYKNHVTNSEFIYSLVNILEE